MPELTLIIDGDCPLCKREAAFLARLDRGRGRLGFADLTDPSFDAAGYGLSEKAIHAEIHAIDGNGGIVKGMEVFRRAYRAVGLGALLAPTGWPLLRGVFDRLYLWFARNRLRFTGRSGCETGSCTRR